MPDTYRIIEACLIGGEWVKAPDGAAIAVVNPFDGARIGEVPRLGRQETRAAIAAASEALGPWKAMTASERAGLMNRLADLILEHKEALGRLLTLEQGKSLAEAVGEVAFGAAYIRWFAEEARRIYGDIIPSPWPGRRILVTREPVGVVGAITPWNFPNSMIARKLGAALAAGCTMVIKPASQTPFSALAVADLALKAGLPPGVVNVVTGQAGEIAAEMCENPVLRKISFTGSTEVGRRLAAQASAHLKRTSMELGGNAPFLVFDDADLDAAIAGAVASKFRNSGQTCVCTNRFLVQAGVHDAFVARLKEAVAALKLGNGLEPGVAQGPLIDEAAVEKVAAHVADAVAKGGQVVLGGRRAELGGRFYEPTIVTGARADMAVAGDETFGPLAAVFRFETEAEAVAMANATEYGLAAYLYTRDLARAFRVSEALEYGLVGVNEGLITTEVAPFGGYKDSGFGKEGSKYGVEDYLNLKYTCLGGLA
ncbi:MAG: NAD-dependent succinate-semialdehyde dehydrogenase [Alphaproteobacteria bacterium]|nr:NAD-dependent succinate-semialdehyde dehydrogenase [Alphaproteobacteria bacterium]